jgi:small multidrug resistance pump
MTGRDGATGLDQFRPWFRAAAAYNVAWGLAVIVAPETTLDILGVADPGVVPFWQAIGSFVLLFGPGYFWAAVDPVRHGHLVLIGLAGKVLGVIGFVLTVTGGALPPSVGITILANDVIWLPAFAVFAVRRMRIAGSWRALLSGT